MNENVIIFLCNLLIPMIMVAAGFMMYRFPPKSINSFYGYRSSMAKKNMDTWMFAQMIAGRNWLIAGSVLMMLSAAVQVPYVSRNAMIPEKMVFILEAVQLSVLLLSIVPVEYALRRNYDKQGNRK